MGMWSDGNVFPITSAVVLAFPHHPPDSMNEARMMLRVVAFMIATRMVGPVRNFENLFARMRLARSQALQRMRA